MATTNDLKNGMVLNLDGQLWSVIWFQHHKPGKGGAVVRTKLKNVESGKTVDKTFNADVKVEIANVDKRTMQYLYNDGTSYVFMDTATYEQTRGPAGDRRRRQNFLLENQDAIVATNEGRVLYIELPASVELVVEYTEPGLQGDRSTGGTKPATLETGHEIKVPLFITTGEKIKVDTRDSSYLGRVSVLMAARSKARKRALDVLFECEVRGLPLGATLDERVVAAEPPVNEYTVAAGPRRRRAPGRASTSCVTTYAQGWTLDRMPAVDRNALRIGVFELLYVDDVPDAVAVSEAMTLVRDLSTDESPASSTACSATSSATSRPPRRVRSGRRSAGAPSGCRRGPSNRTKRPQGCRRRSEHSTPRPRRWRSAASASATTTWIICACAVGHHVQPDAEADRAGRPRRRDLHEAQPLVDGLVVVDAPADLVAVEVDGPVDVGHGQRDELDLPVHVTASPRVTAGR